MSPRECFVVLAWPSRQHALGNVANSTLPARPLCARRPRVRPCMRLLEPGRVSLYAGIGVLAGVLTNRLVFTPLDSLALAQSRSDILGVITGATLVLYGVGKAEILDAKQAVELGGVDVRQGFKGGDGAWREELAVEAEWAADTMMAAIPNIRSCAIVVEGVGELLVGRFRNAEVTVPMRKDGVVDTALRAGKRAYLADMKVVPVKEVEFGFLPSNCQAVMVQPISDRSVIILGADKPRPFTGSDFGWLQAISDRLSGVIAMQNAAKSKT